MLTFHLQGCIVITKEAAPFFVGFPCPHPPPIRSRIKGIEGMMLHE